jgi:hypothetical protein
VDLGWLGWLVLGGGELKFGNEGVSWVMTYLFEVLPTTIVVLRRLRLIDGYRCGCLTRLDNKLAECDVNVWLT